MAATEPVCVFAFDFIVERLSELKEKNRVHIVEFKLLDFPAVCVAVSTGETSILQQKSHHHVVAGDSSKSRTSAQRTTDTSGGSSLKVNRGKSVVFEMNPEELFQDLKKTPLEVCLLDTTGTPLAAGLPSRSLPFQSTTRPIAKGLLDLSEMAASMETALIAPDNVCEREQGWKMNPCKHCRRAAVVVTDGTGVKVAKLRVKYRMACVTDDDVLAQRVHRQNNVRETFKKLDTSLDRKSEADEMPENQSLISDEKTQEQELLPDFGSSGPAHTNTGASEQTVCSSNHNVVDTDNDKNNHSMGSVATESDHNPSRVDQSDQNVTTLDTGDQNVHQADTRELSDTGNQTSCMSTSDSHSTSSSDDEVLYVPNSVCPPPLLYRSEHSRAAAHTHHIRPCSQQPMMSSAPLRTEDNRVWCESIAQTEGYNDWLILAQYDQSSHPLTTRLKSMPKTSHNSCNVEEIPFTEHSASVKNLPLLSALLEELSCLNSHVKLSNLSAKTKQVPEKVSTFSQTENVPAADQRVAVAEVRLVKEKKVRIAQWSETSASGGRFVRECCRNIKPKKKLIPSNKSVLYPPDIKHKWRVFSPKKQSKGSKRAPSAAQLPVKKTQAVVPKKKVLINKQANKKNGPSMIVSETELVNAGSSSTKKLEVFVPLASHSQSSSALSSPSTSKGPSLSPTMVRREMSRLNAETQTEETIVTTYVEKDTQKSTATSELSVVQTEVVELAGESETAETSDAASEDNDDSRAAHTQTSSGSDPVTHHLESVSPSLLPRDDSPATAVPNSPPELRQAIMEASGSSPQGLKSEDDFPSASPTLPLGVRGGRRQQRRLSDAPQSLLRFKLSRHKFSSTGDVSTALPESPLLHNTRDSLTSIHEAAGAHPATIPENALQKGRSLDILGGSQTFDSLMSTTDVLAAMGGGKGILPKHLREGIVYLATSQSSLGASENGWLERTGELATVGNGEGGENSREASGGIGRESDYSDDFEYSDTFEHSTNSSTCSSD